MKRNEINILKINIRALIILALLNTCLCTVHYYYGFKINIPVLLPNINTTNSTDCNDMKSRHLYENFYENRMVPDKYTAARIAEAVWYSVYGDRIYQKRPYEAKLIDNRIWIIRNIQEKDMSPKDRLYIEIKKSDGTILYVLYGIDKLN
jgi:hypothetical protein